MRQLVKFAITVRETDFVVHVTDETGAVIDFEASTEQMDGVIEALNDLLTEEDEDAAGMEGPDYET